MPERYVILPAYGFKSDVMAATASLRAIAPMTDDDSGIAVAFDAEEPGPEIRVLDAVSVDGPRLVEMTAEAELALKLEEASLKIVPVVEYRAIQSMPEVQH